MPVYLSQLVVSDYIPGIVLSIAFYWAAAASSYRIITWIRTPSPLPIPLTPAPRTVWGVVARLLLEFFAFRSLARANLITWLASMAFHYGLLLVLIVHCRFLFFQLPLSLVPFIVISGWVTIAMLLGLAVLLARRILVDRVRYISAPSDYLHLLLLLAILLSGVLLKRVWSVDLLAVGLFLRGALSLNWQPAPESVVFLIHLVLVIALLLVFPMSKLLHGAGVIVNPTLSSKDPHSNKHSTRSSTRGN